MGTRNTDARQALSSINSVWGQNHEVSRCITVSTGPKGSPDVSPLEKSQLLFKEFTVLDDALSWARHLEGTGRIPLLIEGDDGTRMNRRAIIDALRVGMREQLD
jgi:hypothetical protein